MSENCILRMARELIRNGADGDRVVDGRLWYDKPFPNAASDVRAMAAALSGRNRKREAPAAIFDLNSVANEIECTICIDLFKNPHLLVPCLHTFCKECIDRVSATGENKCPMCRQDFLQTRQNFALLSIVDLVTKAKAQRHNE